MFWIWPSEYCIYVSYSTSCSVGNDKRKIEVLMSKKQYMIKLCQDEHKKADHAIWQFIFYISLMGAMFTLKAIIPYEHTAAIFRMVSIVVMIWCSLCIPYYFFVYARSRLKLKRLLSMLDRFGVR